MTADFQMPISPADILSIKAHQPSLSPGQRLFDHALALYAWYLAWTRYPQDQHKAFEDLLCIMRIAQVSIQGGMFLSDDQERTALGHLFLLVEDLSSGKLLQKKIPERIHQILEDLTHKNDKAQIISLLTIIEFSIPHASNISLKGYILELISRINPELKDRNASVIVQELKKILKTPSSCIDKMKEAIFMATITP